MQKCGDAGMVKNYRTVFPASEYFAQRGSDDTAENYFVLQPLALLLYLPAQKAFSFAGENESHFVHFLSTDGETL